MSYYITRIFNNKLKLSVILFIFVAPILDILMAFVDVFKGASVPVPGLVTFWGSFMTAGLRGVLKGYLPLFLAIIVADDCIEDYRIGYKNILITKRGKNKYFALNMLKSFTVSFFVLIIPLLLNLLMVHIVFAGGTYIPADVEMLKSEPNLLQSYSNPMFYNILYILVFSFIGGIVGSGATALAMAFPNRFILYPLAFILWYISTAIKPSIIGALTPFTVDPLSHYTFTIIFVVAINIVAALFSFFKVTKYDQV